MAHPLRASVPPASDRQSPGGRAKRRFLRNRLAVAGGGLVILLMLTALLAPWLATHDPTAMRIEASYSSPSGDHWFGTDELGRDVFSRIVWGARIVVGVSVTSTLLATAVGVVLGLAAGYYRGMTDVVLSRTMDVLMAFPAFLLAVGLVSVLGPSLWSVVVVVGITRLPRYFRMTRGETMRVTELEYVSAARAIGATDVVIMVRHILPNCIGPVLILSSLTLGDSILTVSALSFLGIGIQPPTADWGVMLSRGREFLLVAPWLPMFPGTAIFVTVMGFNLLGDGLRDALDPRSAS